MNTSLRWPRTNHPIALERRKPTALTRAVIGALIGIVLAFTIMIVLQYMGATVLPKPVEPGVERPVPTRTDR